MFNKYIPHIIILFLLIIISLITYIIISTDITKLFMTDVVKKENVSNTNNDKICLSLSEYNNLITTNKTTLEKSDIVEIRDRKVVSDQLYPPLNRTDNNTHEELVKNINNRGMYIRTNDINDKYRLVAYVTNSSEERDAGNNNWKLFARQKDRNISDFYMKPTDNNNDMKVPITDDIVIGDRLRDIYNIPKQLTFNSPLFNKNPYNVVEIPKADLSNSGDYI
jgi:hypothetical protein